MNTPPETDLQLIFIEIHAILLGLHIHNIRVSVGCKLNITRYSMLCLRNYV